MYTLNCKALLVKTGLLVFIRAIGIYLLVTLPALGVPVMYMLSAMYVVSFGWIAAACFLFVLYLLQQMKAATAIKMLLLYCAVVIAVAAAFQMMEIMGAQNDIWQSGGFLLFPAVAVVSGWISIAVSGRKIKELFAPVPANHYETIISSLSTEKQTILNKVS